MSNIQIKGQNTFCLVIKDSLFSAQSVSGLCSCLTSWQTGSSDWQRSQESCWTPSSGSQQEKAASSRRRTPIGRGCQARPVIGWAEESCVSYDQRSLIGQWCSLIGLAQPVNLLQPSIVREQISNGLFIA